ncbi:carbohydrate ABC transporter permease [Microbacterium sp. DT81.1]|uniref:carbohydrate ABC transporter permease n=1 Tax=Microbacterium sp. DT81.1 TaxID=3393413 RepID=UPI003CEFEFC7
MRRTRRRLTPGRLFGIIFMTVAAAITVLPLMWMLKTAFSFNADLFADPGAWIPEQFTWLNFKRVLGFATPEEAALTGGVASIDFMRYLGNSLLFTFVTVIGQVIFCTAAGYVFARVHFRGRNAIFVAFLAGMFIPAILVTIPNFVLIKDLGWINTYAGLIAPFLLMSPFAIFFMRQFFLGYPAQLEEAARMDGLGVFGTFARVVIPTSIPPMITLAVIVGVTQWQEFLWPLLVAKAPDARPLTVALSIFSDQSQGSQIDWSGLMAASTLSVVPVIIVLLLIGKRLVGSIQLNGLR